MTTYTDKWGRWHNKPTDGIVPSSNNGWIYSAYAKYLADEELNMFGIEDCYYKCLRQLGPIKVDRHPGDLEPPISKDEIIGMLSLNLLDEIDLELSHWNFCNLPEYKQEKLTFEIVQKAKEALEAIEGEHRNYVWENKVVEAYPLAFALAPWDIYYAKKLYGRKANLLEFILFYGNIISVLHSDNKSTKMMLWLQLKDLKHPLVKLLPIKKYVLNYFGKDHPFYKSWRNNG